MKPLYFLFIFLFLAFSCKDAIKTDEQTFPTVFENSEGQQTATYDEVIDFYLRLAKEFPSINVQTIGGTDCGYPLHLVTYNPEANFNFQKIREEKSLLLINNGIHPGEPDGIDATMLLFRDLAQKQLTIPKNLVITTIPVYNVGGMLNRNGTTRVNQNGPVSYGFRGNALNYDLNRDFIKMDTKNAITFANIFHLVKPDVFIDNHVSNGADYQYTLTHLFTQHNKLGGELGTYLNDELVPSLEKGLLDVNFEITPYVNVFNRPPDNGFSQFMDHPRYSTGYTTLWNTLGMMVETHMLKAYKPRVQGTYELMKKMVEIIELDHKKIKSLRSEANELTMNSEKFLLNWTLDTTKTSSFIFKGFEADTIISEITGMPRLKYDKEKPFEKEIHYQNEYYPKDTITIPEAYIIKKGWQKVIDRLTANEIEFYELEEDTLLTVEGYGIASYETFSRPYEGHYPHYNTEVSVSKMTVSFSKGDYIVPSKQAGIRYLLETLEPQAVDSFFNWNFFDTVLQQKEGFSPYVFEDLALTILEENPALRDSLEYKKQKDETFAKNWYGQLDWIYKNSQYREPSYLQYPVYRILKENGSTVMLKN
ncbi:MAG: M14 family metallopeptidase [Bacteroidota bacterium]